MAEDDERRWDAKQCGALMLVAATVASALILPEVWNVPDTVVADDGGEDEGLAADAESGEDASIRSDEVLEILVDLLPPGEIVEQWAAEPPEEGVRQPAAGGVVFDDGDGAGAVTITVDDLGYLARSRQFAADLGDGWTAPERPGEYDVAAVPTAENAAALPGGDVRVSMLRDSIGRAPAHEYLDLACQARTEKGREWDDCVAATSPAGDEVWLQWSRSVDDPQSVPTDGLTVMYEQDDNTVIRVMLSVSQPVDESTPDRREAVVEWIEAQIAVMIRAANSAGTE